jgi:hypothetical protein
LHFFLRQMRHQAMVSFLEWNCQHTANLLNGGWLPVLQKKEGIAAKRIFRVFAQLPRVLSRYCTEADTRNLGAKWTIV